MSESLGSRLQAARQKAGKTQADVAAALGVRRAGVAEWEADVHRPQPERLREIAQLYGLPPDTFDAPAPAIVADPRHLLPGYWVGRLDGILEAYEQANGRLRAFVQDGARWEANLVRAAAERAAHEAATLAGREASAADVLASFPRYDFSPQAEAAREVQRAAEQAAAAARASGDAAARDRATQPAPAKRRRAG